MWLANLFRSLFGKQHGKRTDQILAENTKQKVVPKLKFFQLCQT
jgi:hypothetical protein